jgi:hypothetical protein
VRQRLGEFGFTVNTQEPATPEQLARQLAVDYAAIGETLKSINYKPE